MKLTPLSLLTRPQVMAIINVTPDSFYEASRTPSVEALEERVRQVVAEGADIIDIGGVSTRPNASEVSLDEEWRRVDMALSVVRRIAPEAVVAIDTFRSEIVRRAVASYGEVIVNDITGGDGDEQMVSTVAELGLNYVAMHMRGTPQTMQQMTSYSDVTSEVCTALRDKAERMVHAGISRDRIALDPGFGFAKDLEQNYRLLAELNYLCALGYPVLVGLSRKSMIYNLLSVTPFETLAATQALQWEALRQGAMILRTHDVREAVQVVKMFEIFSNQIDELGDDD